MCNDEKRKIVKLDDRKEIKLSISSDVQKDTAFLISVSENALAYTLLTSPLGIKKETERLVKAGKVVMLKGSK